MVAAIHACMVASDHRNLTVLGVKIGIRPLDASLDARMAYISSALAHLHTAP